MWLKSSQERAEKVALQFYSTYLQNMHAQMQRKIHLGQPGTVNPLCLLLKMINKPHSET